MTFMTITYRAFSCLWERTSQKRVLTCVCYGLVILLGTMAHSVVNAQVYDFGQSKECTILYFDALKDRDLRVVQMYSHAMIAAGYRVTVKNYYDEDLNAEAKPASVRREKKNPKFWLDQKFVSDRFISDDQQWFEEKPINIRSGSEESGIAKLKGDVYWLTESYSRDWGSGWRNLTYKMDVRGKKIPKYKRGVEGPKSSSNRLFLIYPNDKVAHLYSCERFEAIPNNSSLVVDVRDNQLLRPEGGGVYKVPFDSVGYFATYNVVLQGRSGDVSSSAPLINEEVKWGRDGKPELYLERGSSRSRCYLVIDETYLSNLCLQIRSKNNTEVLPGDDGCDVCAAECLYKSVFSLSVQGLPIGDCSGGWSDGATIRFQCTK